MLDEVMLQCYCTKDVHVMTSDPRILNTGQKSDLQRTPFDVSPANFTQNIQ